MDYLKQSFSLLFALLLSLSAMHPGFCLDDFSHPGGPEFLSQQSQSDSHDDASHDDHAACCKYCGHQVLALNAQAAGLSSPGAIFHFSIEASFVPNPTLDSIDHPPASQPAA